MLPINIANLYSIPAEMRQFNSWVLWKNEDDTKRPYRPNNRLASPTEPRTWTSFGDVVGTLQTCPQVYSGAGFVFSERDPYAGIDLDNVPKKLAEMADRAKADGRPIDEAELADKRARWGAQQTLIYKQFNSYTEISPSGKGGHIIIRVTDKKKIWQGRRRNAVEMYCQGRFFTMTGNVYLPAPIAERQGLAGKLWAKMGPEKEDKQTYQGDMFETYSDDEIISFALDARNGEKFSQLLDGNWQDLYESQSQADFAFCNIIGHYSKCGSQIVRIFRNSPLGQRKKAQRSDYVEYMLKRVWDNKLPPVDRRGLVNPFLKGEVK